MDENEKRLSIEALRRSQETFVDALSGVPEAEAVWKPAADRWSVLECAEHVALVEGGMLRLVRGGTPIDGSAAHDREREERIKSNGQDRSRKLVAPERACPSGRFPSLSEAVDHFVKSRAQTVQFVESCQDDLRRLSTPHPVFGQITCQECLLLLIGHPIRHAGQVREIRALARAGQRL